MAKFAAFTLIALMPLAGRAQPTMVLRDGTQFNKQRSNNDGSSARGSRNLNARNAADTYAPSPYEDETRSNGAPEHMTIPAGANRLRVLTNVHFET